MNTILCERMGGLKLGQTGVGPVAPTVALPSGLGAGGPEAKFYHYCYVCNTQLNSCKQALLHCSGKRHQKKLHFLQSRKGQAPPPAPAIHTFHQPPPPHPHPQHQFFSALPSPPSIHPQAPAHPFFIGAQPPHHSPGHFLGGQGPPHFPIHPSQLPLHHQQQALAQFGLVPHGFRSPASSSPLLSSGEVSSSYSGGPRSAVISPSETSSLSSEGTGGSRSHRCDVCGRQYVSASQLHLHLHQAKHYKRRARSPPRLPQAKDTGFCGVCKVGLNSAAQAQLHAQGHKQKGRLGHCPSSSASSDGCSPALDDDDSAPTTDSPDSPDSPDSLTLTRPQRRRSCGRGDGELGPRARPASLPPPSDLHRPPPASPAPSAPNTANDHSF